MREYPHFIDGRWHAPNNDQWIDSINPATGDIWARVARGDGRDATIAVEAASRALTRDGWSTSNPKYRIEILLNIADKLEAHWETLVTAEIKDNGKRISEVKTQFAALHKWFRYFAEQVEKIESHRLENDVAGIDNFALYEPFGVIAAITPWNSPLMIATWKIAPALAAGNTVVIKPSEHASISTLLFAELISESNLPQGVVNVLCGLGDEAGKALIHHPAVAKVSFTGSNKGGRSVAASAALGTKPVTLELGGKSPQIVFADADNASAIHGVLSGIFLSSGQTCVAGSRLILQDSIYDEFIHQLIKRTANLTIGDPLNPKTNIGPLANEAQFKKVLFMIENAKQQGGECIYGGEQVYPEGFRQGFFIQPTIIANVTADMQLWTEEVFGPVLAITKFNSESEAVDLANDSPYGLAAGIWTSNQARSNRVAKQVIAGTVYINHYRSVSAGSPIGGYRQSGYGRELGPDAIKDFLQIKSVWRGTLPMSDPFQ